MWFNVGDPVLFWRSDAVLRQVHTGACWKPRKSYGIRQAFYMEQEMYVNSK
jgi:hypothetical protein